MIVQHQGEMNSGRNGNESDVRIQSHDDKFLTLIWFIANAISNERMSDDRMLEFS